jgi:hypothetical protein
MRIICDHIYPPIPDRRFDWQAATDNYEEGHPVGHGPTKEAAIKDLMDEHCVERGGDTLNDGTCRLCFALPGEACRAELP